MVANTNEHEHEHELPEWAQPLYDVDTSPARPYVANNEEMAWLGGFYDNCGIVSNYADYPRLIFTHKSPPVLRRLELLTDTTAWFQTNRSVTGRIMLTGKPALNRIIALGDYIYAREADVKLAREYMSAPLDRVTPLSNDEIINLLIHNSGTLHRSGKPRSTYTKWYYSRFAQYFEPPADESTFWSYIAGVLESRTDIAALHVDVNPSLPLHEVIWIARKWICERYNLGDAVDDLATLPSKFTLDVIERIWPYTAIGAEETERDGND